MFSPRSVNDLPLQEAKRGNQPSQSSLALVASFPLFLAQTTYT